MNKLTNPDAIVQPDWQYSYDGGGVTGVIPDVGPVQAEWVGKRARDTGTAWEYFLVPPPFDPKTHRYGSENPVLAARTAEAAQEYLTKEEGNGLADIVRNSPPSADTAILWAVRHHLALYYNRLASAEEVCDAIFRAANGHSEENITTVLGIERCLQLSGRPLTLSPR